MTTDKSKVDIIPDEVIEKEAVRRQILEILKECQYDFDYGHSKNVGPLYIKMVDRNKASYKLVELIAGRSKTHDEKEQIIKNLRIDMQGFIDRDINHMAARMEANNIIQEKEQRIKELEEETEKLKNRCAVYKKVFECAVLKMDANKIQAQLEVIQGYYNKIFI